MDGGTLEWSARIEDRDYWSEPARPKALDGFRVGRPWWRVGAVADRPELRSSSGRTTLGRDGTATIVAPVGRVTSASTLVVSAAVTDANRRTVTTQRRMRRPRRRRVRRHAGAPMALGAERWRHAFPSSCSPSARTARAGPERRSRCARCATIGRTRAERADTVWRARVISSDSVVRARLRAHFARLVRDAGVSVRREGTCRRTTGYDAVGHGAPSAWRA